MKKLKFYKEDYKWYVDLPEWNGSKADLQMVSGADIMLDYISDLKDEVWLYISDVFFENSDVLKFIRLATEIENGAFYKLEKFKGNDINIEMWLCDVTLFVFGYFPENIYISDSIF